MSSSKYAVSAQIEIACRSQYHLTDGCHELVGIQANMGDPDILVGRLAPTHRRIVTSGMTLVLK